MDEQLIDKITAARFYLSSPPATLPVVGQEF
jgi:hypothetical protein